MFFFLFFMLFTYNIIIAQIEPYFKWRQSQCITIRRLDRNNAKLYYIYNNFGRVAKLVTALALEANGATLEGSSPSPPIQKRYPCGYFFCINMGKGTRTGSSESSDERRSNIWGMFDRCPGQAKRGSPSPPIQKRYPCGYFFLIPTCGKLIGAQIPPLSDFYSIYEDRELLTYFVSVVYLPIPFTRCH